MKKTSPEALEGSLPALVAKLKAFQSSLSPEEKVVFGEIVISAAKHTEAIQQHDLGDLGSNTKPMSVHATTTIKERFLKLPSDLGIEE
jgi:hypothetical protein